MDIVDKETRSRMMSGIRSKNTKPEVLIRKALHAKGFRFRNNDRKLPGTPDIVLKKYNAIIFLHGCFWHGHNCHLFKTPATRTEFWANKIDGNRVRDRKALNELDALGWRICVVWECVLRGSDRVSGFIELIDKLVAWIRSDRIRIELE